MGGVSACPPCGSQASVSQVQNVQAQQQTDAVKELAVMVKVGSGQMSVSDGAKAITSLEGDRAAAQASLTPGAGASTGFSMTDSFDSGASGGAKPKLLDLSGGAATPVQDTSYLAKDSGGGSKPSVAAGSS